MEIDLIIPTFKPDHTLTKSLKRIMEQTIKPNRIILINTEESLFDSSLIEGIDRVEVHHITKASFDHGGTRNMGASMSDAPYIMFMTQDAMPATKHLVEELVKCFENDNTAAAYGRQMADPKKSPIESFTRNFNYPDISSVKTINDLERLGVKTFFCSNVCAMYRKSAYEEMGGFVLKTIFNEDMIMASKLIEKGHAIAYAAKAKVWHWHEYTGMEQLRRNFDLAVSQQDFGGLFLKVKSESEGVKLVKSAIRHLISIKKPYLIPYLIWQSGMKYIGFKLGSNYKKLSPSIINKVTMNPSYWKFDR